MKEREIIVRLSPEEWHYLKGDCRLPRNLIKILNLAERAKDDRRLIRISNDVARRFGSQLTNHLAKVGFGRDYEVNGRGQMLEDLIDRFRPKTRSRRLVWIGLAEIIPRQGNSLLGTDDVGAFVNVIGCALDPERFLKRVVSALDEIEFDLHHLDIESFSGRLLKHPVPGEVRKLATMAQEEGSIVFATFHTFPLSDLEE